MVPTLQRALPIVGSALGRKLGVQVEVAGQRACTDGERILIPAFDPERPEQELLCWGFLSHEAAHVRYTDFDLDQGGSPFRHRLTNLLEDIRIEKAISREYPGAAFSLAEVVRQLVANGRLGAPKANDPPVKVLNDSLLAKLRFEVLGQKALELEAARAHQVMKVCFAKDMLDDLNTLLKEVPALSNTREAQNLADRIINLFENRADQSSTGNSEQESGNAPQDIQNEDQTEAAQESPSESNDTQEQNGDSEPAQEEGLDSEDTQGNENQGSLSEDASDKAEDTENRAVKEKIEKGVLEEILTSAESDWPEDIFQTVACEMEGWSSEQGSSLSAVTTTPQLDKVLVTDADKAAGQSLLWKVKAESARLAAQLTGLVQAQTITRNRTGKRGVRIEGKRLHRVAMDDCRLFSRRSATITIDATVHICLDISASMGARMPLAREAVLALVYALKQINGVTVSASAYPGTDVGRVYPILSANESVQQVAQVLTALDSHDSTPMATGLWHAVHQVLQAKTERRLILMVTDGGPDIDHHKPVLDLVSRCGQSGIEVVGLGINVHTVEQLFPQSLVIDRLDQLKSSMFALTRHWLVG